MSRIYSFVGVHFRQRKCDRLHLCCQIAYNFTVRIVNISTIKKTLKIMNFIIILLFLGKNGSFSLFIHINIVKTIFQSLTEQQCF